MTDPYVREVGQLTEQEGFYVRLGVDYDAVTVQVGGVKATLTSALAEEFDHLFVSAVWQAGQQRARLAEDVEVFDEAERQAEASGEKCCICGRTIAACAEAGRKAASHG